MYYSAMQQEVNMLELLESNERFCQNAYDLNAFIQTNSEGYYSKILGKLWQNKIYFIDHENIIHFEDEMWTQKKIIFFREELFETTNFFIEESFSFLESRIPLKKQRFLFLKKIGEFRFQANVIKQIFGILNLENPKFLEKIPKKHQIGFKNGYFDLEEKKFYKHTIKIVFKTIINYNYLPGFVYEPLEAFLESIFGCNEDKIFFNKTIKNCFHKIPTRYIIFLLGETANGKSTLCDLIGLTFGDLCERGLHSKFLSTESDPTTPDPNLIGLKDKNLAFLSEPSLALIKNNVFKKLAGGGDFVTARNKFQNEAVTFPLITQFYIICNKIPRFEESIEEAELRRIILIKLPHRFVEEPRDLTERKIDLKFRMLLQDDIRYRQAFAVLILEKTTELEEKIPYRYSGNNNAENLYNSENISFVLSILEKTNNKNDYITVESILEEMDERMKNNITLNNYTRNRWVNLLCKFMKIKFKTNYTKINQRRKGENTRGWAGFKIKKEKDE